MTVYQPISFQTNEPPSVIKGPVTIKFTKNMGIIQKLIRKYDEEIDNIKKGTSSFRSGALHLDKGTCPAIEVLKRFKADPNINDLATFFTIASQDFGAMAGKAFEKWAANLFDSGEFEPVAPVAVTEKNHANEINRHLYDLFKRVGVPVGPEEIQAFSLTSEKLARAIDEAVISRCQKLQEAVLNAFNHLEARTKALEERSPEQLKTDFKTKTETIYGDPTNSAGI